MNAAWGGQWDAAQVFISMGMHATTDNLERDDEFTVAFATAGTMAATDYVGNVSGRKVADKVRRTGWTAVKGEKVNAPVFTDFPMTLECRVARKIDPSSTGFFLVGDILAVRVNEEYLSEDGLSTTATSSSATRSGRHSRNSRNSGKSMRQKPIILASCMRPESRTRRRSCGWKTCYRICSAANIRR